MNVLEIIGSETRARILREIWEEELTVGVIATRLGLTPGAVSQQLKALHEVGAVDRRAAGKERWYRANRAALVRFREALKASWTSGLEAIGRAAEQLQQEDKAMGKDIGLEVSRVVDASPETVFRVLADPHRLGQTLGAEVVSEFRPGAPIRFNFNEGRDVCGGKLVALDPPRRLAFTWGQESEPGRVEFGGSLVDILVEPHERGSRLTIKHTGLPSWSEVNLHGPSWSDYLDIVAAAA